MPRYVMDVEVEWKPYKRGLILGHPVAQRYYLWPSDDDRWVVYKEMERDDMQLGTFDTLEGSKEELLRILRIRLV